MQKLCFILFFLLSQNVYSQQNDSLFHTIYQMDSLYFHAQNTCDLEKYSSFLHSDFEFFHDKAGFTSSKEKEMKDMHIFCGEEQRTRQPLRRELIDCSMKVYPMDNFGAIELCEHRFYLQINDGTEKLVGSGKMTAIWKMENKDWKLMRIISYDHQPLSEIKLSEKVLSSFAGTYQLPDRTILIEREDDLLRVTDIINGKPGWTKQLFPESENTFYLNYENVQYKFVKTGTNQAALHIYENGRVIEKAPKRL